MRSTGDAIQKSKTPADFTDFAEEKKREGTGGGEGGNRVCRVGCGRDVRAPVDFLEGLGRGI
jgi:hypothetical protein